MEVMCFADAYVPTVLDMRRDGGGDSRPETMIP